jgi:hemolysin III
MSVFRRRTGPLREWLLARIAIRTHYTPAEEFASAATHALGMALSLIGGVLLVMRAQAAGEFWMTAGTAIYSVSMLTLYSASTFYHLSNGPVMKRVMRILDHCSIYFLIAGTYTPIALRIGAPEGVHIIRLVWGLAAAGILVTLVFWGRMKALHVLTYIGLGWVIAFFWEPLWRTVRHAFIPWAVAGGLTYTLGTLVYAVKKISYAHALWHLFVLAGSICFYFGIYNHVVI